MGIMPPCSAPSSVLRRCQTARQRPCKNYGHRPSLTVPPCNTTGAAELSRFSNIERLRMLRVSDSAGPGSNWLYRAATRSAFTTVVRGRRPEGVISELNGWPTLPLSTLHVQSHDRPRMTRGHNGAAPPFMWGTFTPCSMPVYPGAFTTSPNCFPNLFLSPASLEHAEGSERAYIPEGSKFFVRSPSPDRTKTFSSVSSVSPWCIHVCHLLCGLCGLCERQNLIYCTALWLRLWCAACSVSRRSPNSHGTSER